MQHVHSTYAAIKRGRGRGRVRASVLGLDNTGANDGPSSRSSLYLAERHLIVHFLGLLLILAVAAFALRTASLLHGAPTAAVGAHRLSSKRQGGHHRRSGRFVVKDPLDLAHYIRVQFWDKLKAHRNVSRCCFFLLLSTAFEIFYLIVARNSEKILPIRNAVFREWAEQFYLLRAEFVIAFDLNEQTGKCLPANSGDSRTVDLYWTHRAEGTEHFHSLRTTRWPVVRKNIPIFRPEHTRPAIYPSISESLRRRTCPSTRTPGVKTNITSKTSALHTESRLMLHTWNYVYLNYILWFSVTLKMEEVRFMLVIMFEWIINQRT